MRAVRVYLGTAECATSVLRTSVRRDGASFNKSYAEPLERGSAFILGPVAINARIVQIWALVARLRAIFDDVVKFPTDQRSVRVGFPSM
jgi:hypothetical protein